MKIPYQLLALPYELTDLIPGVLLRNRKTHDLLHISTWEVYRAVCKNIESGRWISLWEPIELVIISEQTPSTGDHFIYEKAGSTHLELMTNTGVSRYPAPRKVVIEHHRILNSLVISNLNYEDWLVRYHWEDIKEKLVSWSTTQACPPCLEKVRQAALELNYPYVKISMLQIKHILERKGSCLVEMTTETLNNPGFLIPKLIHGSPLLYFW